MNKIFSGLLILLLGVVPVSGCLADSKAVAKPVVRTVSGQDEEASRKALLAKIAADIEARTKLNQTVLAKLNEGNYKLSIEEEDALGMLISAPVFAVAPLADNPLVQIRINKIIQRIAAQTERPGLNWRGALIESPEINAYSAPGGAFSSQPGCIKY